MNASDIIKYGHKDVLEPINNLQTELQDVPGVTTSWSVKDTLAHLASYEHLLEDVLNFVLEPGKATPYLEHMKNNHASFNDDYVSKFKPMSFDDVLEDYTKTYETVRGLVDKLGPDKLRQTGTIPWYGKEYSLDDFIVYDSYGHKREHSGQIKQFRKRSE